MTNATTVPDTLEAPANDERADLLELLNTRRHFLRQAIEGMTDEQAASHPTVSALCLGGLIKHVAATEAGWARFIVEGTSAMEGDKDFSEWNADDWAARVAEFPMVDGETVACLLERYSEIAQRTNELVTTLPDLNVSHPLPKAPWFEPGARRTARQVFMHIAAETAQHAGHADIIRESIDGAKSMG